MTNFIDHVNAHFATPASRTKLITLRSLWSSQGRSGSLSERGTFGVSMPLLMERLKAREPHLVTFVEAIVGDSPINLDALLKERLSIPLGKGLIKHVLTH